MADMVHLPAIISDEFGVSRSVARQQILMGMVEIDGVKYEGDGIDIPLQEIDGKTIAVIGRDRHFRMKFDAAKRSEFTR